MEGSKLLDGFAIFDQKSLINKMCFTQKIRQMVSKEWFHIVYRYIKLTSAHAFVAEETYLLSEIPISLTVQKWTKLARLPYLMSSNTLE